jgi:phage head maturation protease
MMLHRATAIADATGRTMSGVGFHFERASKVTDPGRPAYLEMFARGSPRKSLREHAEFPLFIDHSWTKVMGGDIGPEDLTPVGTTYFEADDASLSFEAVLGRGYRQDELLERAVDLGVSVGFRPIRNGSRGAVTVRQEIALVELSIADTTRAQHDGAKVLAVRAAGETPRLDDLRKKLNLLVCP